jgi:hypothetical protein
VEKVEVIHSPLRNFSTSGIRYAATIPLPSAIYHWGAIRAAKVQVGKFIG